MKSFCFALPLEVCEILGQLHKAGYEAYIIGGCVRDLILYDGRISPSDWDITTSATPSECMEIFDTYRVIPTGLKHGTISIVINKKSYEVTTFRIDGEYRDSRSPESVSFTRSLQEDVARRDFTINALAYSPDVGLIDLVGGLEHLSQKQLVCVGEAKKRFSEDALRVLRALRFASTLGFSLHSQTKQALFESQKGLKHISKERVKSELEKLICGDYTSVVLDEFGCILIQVLPELASVLALEVLWKHTLLVMQNTPKVPLFRWVALFENLFLDEGQNAYGQRNVSGLQSILKRLCFDRQSTQRILHLLTRVDLPFGDCMRDVRMGLRDFGEVFMRDWIVFQKARAKAFSASESESRLAYYEHIECLMGEILSKKLPFCLKDLAINGRDLQSIGMKNGKRIGEVLEFLLSQVIEQKLENKPSELLKKAQELANPRP